MSTFITLDARRRANLASIADHDQYQVTREPNGRIILDPAVVITEDELAVMRDASVWQASDEAIKKGGRNPRHNVKKK